MLASSDRRTRGSSVRSHTANGTMTSLPTPGGAARVTTPETSVSRAAMVASSSAAQRAICCALGSSRCPLTVSEVPRRPRWNSDTPRVCSSAAMRRLTVGWPTSSASAAALKLPCSATARNICASSQASISHP